MSTAANADWVKQVRRWWVMLQASVACKLYLIALACREYADGTMSSCGHKFHG